MPRPKRRVVEPRRHVAAVVGRTLTKVETVGRGARVSKGGAFLLLTFGKGKAAKEVELDAPVVTGPARGLLNLARALPPQVRLHVALLRGRRAAAGQTESRRPDADGAGPGHPGQQGQNGNCQDVLHDQDAENILREFLVLHTSTVETPQAVIAAIGNLLKEPDP